MEIIIGLPGSGKSYLCKEFEKKGYIVFDDFISHFYDGKLIELLECDKNKEIKICISDPRLCNYNTFLRFIETFSIYFYENPKNIHLTLFENDAERCLENVKRRNSQGDLRKGVEKSISYLSAQYDLNNYTKDYPHAILPVYIQ